MKVVYLEDYRVTLAELMIPAADISEQISLAGTEASGTGNMKFMINGAITLGTLDGANVEIHETVGDENMLLFGMTTPEAQSLSKNGYQSKLFYDNNPVIKHAIEEMRSGLNGFEFHDIANNLINVDPYTVSYTHLDVYKRQAFFVLVPYPGVFQEYGCPTQQRCRLPKRHHPDAVLQQLSLFLMQDFVPNMQDRPEISLHQFQQEMCIRDRCISLGSCGFGVKESRKNRSMSISLHAMREAICWSPP